MRWWSVGAVALLFCSLVAAQVVVPTQGQIVVSGPLVSPPFVDLGNGVNPPVITNRTNLIISMPATTEMQPTGVTAYAGTGTTGGVTGAAADTGTPQQTARFEYVIAPKTGGIGDVVGAGDTRSLGEVAAAMRNRGVAQPGHVYTNDDLARLNGGAASETNPQDNTMAQGTQPGQTAPATSAQGQPGKRSPFAPPPGVTGGMAQTTQNAAAATNQPAYAQRSNTGVAAPQNEAGQREGVATQSTEGQQQQKQELPRSSTMLPLITLIGAMLAGAGAVYWKLR